MTSSSCRSYLRLVDPFFVMPSLLFSLRELTTSSGTSPRSTLGGVAGGAPEEGSFLPGTGEGPVEGVGRAGGSTGGAVEGGGLRGTCGAGLGGAVLAGVISFRSIG